MSRQRFGVRARLSMDGNMVNPTSEGVKGVKGVKTETPPPVLFKKLWNRFAVASEKAQWKTG